MVRHDDEFIQGDHGKPRGQPTPCQANHLPNALGLQKQVSVVGADGDEIGCGLRIVISREADGTPLADLNIVFHSETMIQGRGKGAASSAPTPSSPTSSPSPAPSPRCTRGSRSRGRLGRAQGNLERCVVFIHRRTGRHQDSCQALAHAQTPPHLGVRAQDEANYVDRVAHFGTGVSRFATDEHPRPGCRSDCARLLGSVRPTGRGQAKTFSINGRPGVRAVGVRFLACGQDLAQAVQDQRAVRKSTDSVFIDAYVKT